MGLLANMWLGNSHMVNHIKMWTLNLYRSLLKNVKRDIARENVWTLALAQFPLKYVNVVRVQVI